MNLKTNGRELNFEPAHANRRDLRPVVCMNMVSGNGNGDGGVGGDDGDNDQIRKYGR